MNATASKPNGRAPRVPLLNTAREIEPTATASVRQSTPTLDAAVALVQASAPQLSRNARGQIGSRGYGYATLDAIVDVVLPLLVEHGLVWKALPTTLDGQPALRYRMTHISSGEFDEDVMPLLCERTSQGLGSAITYARRYSLCAYLNLTVDPDDDGAAANHPPASQPTSQPTSQPQPTAQRPPQSGGRPATVKQRGMIRAKARDGALSAAALADVILKATGNEPRHMAEEQAERWLKMGLERLPGAAVDAVVAGIEEARA